MKELDTVVLLKNRKKDNLKAGDIGTIVYSYNNGNAYEVEFVTGNGRTAAVITLEKEMIRKIDNNEIFHARCYSKAS